MSTPREMARLIEVISKGEGLSPALAEDLRAVVGVPKSAETAFRRGLPEGPAILDKGGSLEGVRSAAGVVALKYRPYALAVSTTALKNEPDGENAIREISRMVYETFDRLDRMAPEGRLLGR